MNNEQHPARRLRHGDRPTEALSFDDAPAAAAPVDTVNQAPREPSQITDTDSARRFVDAWHRQHFPTDRTFSRYIMSDPARSNPLAGDFAFQLAKALEAMGATPVAANQTDRDADIDAALDEAKEGASILRDLMASIDKHGNYSKDATLCFLGQIKQCIDGTIEELSGSALKGAASK